VVRDSGEDAHDCQPYGGRERGGDAMANGSALPIHVVRANQPKGLRGLDHKGCGQWKCSRVTSRRCGATGEQAEPTASSGTRVERGQPVSLP
jgi:hypothetical protein